MSNIASDMVLVFSFVCFLVAGVLSGSVAGFFVITISGFLFGLFMVAMYDL